MTITLPLDTGKIAAALKNKHVSIPMILAAVPELVRLWYPAWYTAHQEAIQGTQKLLYTYGGLAAGITALPSQENKAAIADLQNQVNAVKPKV